MVKRTVDNPFVGLGSTTGAPSTIRLVPSSFCVAMREPVAALQEASVGLLPLISIQSIIANSEETVVSSLILFAPATRVTGIHAVVVQVSQAVVLGKAALLTTCVPFTSTRAVVALCEPALEYRQRIL